ncbi:MAG TPA: DUF3000 domain-containing protein [Nocardioidaceae bacterium]|nr:DUF3000 domain-containing protein [Nocardioidaceae bacterium]
MAAHREVDAAPEEFRVAVDQLRVAVLRPEVHCEEMPAPQRIAPYAAALSADLTVDGADCGGGRLVLLYDPAGNDAWEGSFRCVTFVRADIDQEMAGEPLLGEVAWSWLVEALSAHGATMLAPSGTVTTVSSQGFGGMADEPTKTEVEIRASWSPVGSLTAHVEAWGELMCTAGGLPPLPTGVVMMPGRRGQRGR